MAKKIGKSTILMEENPLIFSFGSVVSKKEGKGPLAKFFDIISEDPMFGQSSWEQAESQMQQDAIKFVLKNSNTKSEDIDFLFAGDLLNQCTGTSYGVKNFKIPFCGLYGACSTMAESLSMASIFIDSNIAQKCLAMTSSHFCSAEKQYRFPVQYGSQRTPTAQWTVTGSGAIIVAKNKNLKNNLNNNELSKNNLHVEAVTIGTIEDLGITDVNNMGAAMAPAAASTILNYFKDTNDNKDSYDMIVTGDLGYVGSEILLDILNKEGLDISKNHTDCGKLIFNREPQDVHSGGSGCGCSASVLCSYLLKNMQNKNINKILFIATGALMSPTSIKQGQSIPCIAHLVKICN